LAAARTRQGLRSAHRNAWLAPDPGDNLFLRTDRIDDAEVTSDANSSTSTSSCHSLAWCRAPIHGEIFLILANGCTAAREPVSWLPYLFSPLTWIPGRRPDGLYSSKNIFFHNLMLRCFARKTAFWIATNLVDAMSRLFANNLEAIYMYADYVVWSCLPLPQTRKHCWIPI
jgi:hypothetical protein